MREKNSFIKIQMKKVDGIRNIHLIAALDFLRVAGKTLWNFCSFPGRGNKSSYGSPKVRYRHSEIQFESFF